VSNFAFLQAEWPDLFDEARRAERLTIADPRASCFYARRALELALTWLYRVDASLTLPADNKINLQKMISTGSMRTLVGDLRQQKMHLIRNRGNRAVHDAAPVTAEQAMPVVKELFHVLYWVARTYSRDPAAVPSDALVFDPQLVPRPAPDAVQPESQARLKELADQLAAQTEALATERAIRADLDAELTRLRAEIAAAKAANAARPDNHDYDEAATRDLFIDVLLREAGWALDRPEDREFEVTGMPNNTGVGYVDYVLWGADGLPLGVVEAKRTGRDPRVGQQQAKLYADCLERRYGQRPVIYYTNGYDTWFWDDTAYPPRPVQGFHTRDELQLLIQRRSTRRTLADLEINPAIVERHYQQRAIRRIAEVFETDRRRAALVVMATGAGKTRTVIALVDLLMRANWVKRVLFLADRTALVNQAANAFRTHLPEATTVNLVTEKHTEARVYVSTYPTMMNLIDLTVEGRRRFGPGYFDLIVVDEAHRSVYQKYRSIFTYFDSLLVGLTATPRADIDHNTYRLFDLEDGMPTDHYDLDEAVREGYLVPPRAISVPLKFQREGIRYDQLTDEEKERWDSLDWGDEEPPDEVDADAVNKWLFNIDTVDKVLATLMTQGHRVAGGDRLGKTIIFAKNQEHARFIVERFDANYPQLRGAFARVITHQSEYAQSLIDDFSGRDRDPHIAVSVDMLDTGIDVPEVVNLVFFKLVRSRPKFWQMIGRGTRLCPDLYGPGRHKQDFYIFDFCQNFEYFNQNPEVATGSRTESLTERLFKARLELIHQLDQRLPDDAGPPPDDADATGSMAGLRWYHARALHGRIAGMTTDNFVVRAKRRVVAAYADFDRWHRLTPEAVEEIGTNLAGLPSTVRDDDDETAKRFDLLVLRLQLAQFIPEPGYERLRQQAQEIASALLEQTSIPVIRQEQELLDEVAGDQWWRDVTPPMLETLRRRVRTLVKLVPKVKRPIVYTDFADELGAATEVRLSGIPGGVDIDRFRARTRAYLTAHQDHLTLRKLRGNRELTPADLAELERMLVDNGIGTEEDVERARRCANGFGLFLRGLVGLDRAAATEAFGGFLANRNLTSRQLDFINLIIDELTRDGAMKPDRLFEDPFTENAPTGPESVFPDHDDVVELVTILRTIRANAAPAEQVA
jgi:type I restriction enzyme R subunit